MYIYLILDFNFPYDGPPMLFFHSQGEGEDAFARYAGEGVSLIKMKVGQGGYEVLKPQYKDCRWQESSIRL